MSASPGTIDLGERFLSRKGPELAQRRSAREPENLAPDLVRPVGFELVVCDQLAVAVPRLRFGHLVVGVRRDAFGPAVLPPAEARPVPLAHPIADLRPARAVFEVGPVHAVLAPGPV